MRHGWKTIAANMYAVGQKVADFHVLWPQGQCGGQFTASIV